jgi:Na+/alanine symporter
VFGGAYYIVIGMTKRKKAISFAEVELLTLLGLIKNFTATFKLSNCIKEVTTHQQSTYYCFSDH